MTRVGVRLPTGAQHHLAHGGQRATVVEVGGGLREYEVHGYPILDGYADHEMARSSRGQVLVPWPNRLARGHYQFGGEDLSLPIGEPSHGNAIHGLVRWSAWEAVEVEASRVRMAHVLWPQPGYPFTLALEVEYRLSDEGLGVTMRAENVGDRPAPYGAGMHPYVRAALDGIDGTVLKVPALQWLEADDHKLPTGRLLDVAGTPLDFRQPRPLGTTAMDTAFTGLLRDDAGIARTELRADGRVVTVWMDGHFDYLMVYTADGLPPGEARRAMGVEPMTCAPDAFNNGLGLVVLEPGEHVSGTWGISVTS